jgi:hypothetical protein
MSMIKGILSETFQRKYLQLWIARISNPCGRWQGVAEKDYVLSFFSANSFLIVTGSAEGRFSA